MKKLLGILGTITIAGSGMAGLVGNAPAKNAINYQQTNNLENLIRVRREPQNDYYGSGQQTFNLSSLFMVKNISIEKPSRFGPTANNPPSSWRILSKLIQANPGVQGKAREAITVGWSTRDSAEIHALPNTPFYGSFVVYY